MIVSPDGVVLSEKEDIMIISEIDIEKIKKIRSEIPRVSLIFIVTFNF